MKSLYGIQTEVKNFTSVVNYKSSLCLFHKNNVFLHQIKPICKLLLGFGA